MAEFLCRIMNKDGSIVEKNQEAENVQSLIYSFNSTGIKIISIDEVKKNLANKQISFAPKKLKTKSLVLFCRQLATLIQSGVPMVNCFDIIGSQSNETLFKSTMAELTTDVKRGMVLSKALKKQEPVFPTILCEMVAVGELTGDIYTVLDRMASQYEADIRIKRKVTGALIYPLILTGIAVAATIFMLIFVVPEFVSMFESLDSELPFITQMLLISSNFITKFWYIAIAIAIGAGYGLHKLWKNPNVRIRIDEGILKRKPFQSPVQKIVAAQFSRTLCTMTSAGVPIIQAMEYTNRNVGNLYANGIIDTIILGLKQGKGLATQLAEQNIFPKLLISMITIGETSGNIEDMLEKTADYFDEELDAAISQLTSLLEPIMILIVGILIGGIVMALYAPMFSMITAISGS